MNINELRNEVIASKLSAATKLCCASVSCMGLKKEMVFNLSKTCLCLSYRVEQRMTGNTRHVYGVNEAQVILSKVNELRQSLHNGEHERRRLIEVNCDFRDSQIKSKSLNYVIAS